MKILAVLLLICSGAAAEPLTLVSVLPDRPAFNLVTDGLTQTRALAPANRLRLEPAVFSGLGLKRVPLAGGQTYYLARFGAVPGLYALPPDQVLILNQAGRPVDVTIDGTSATVASGGFILGGAAQAVGWNDNGPQTAAVTGGKVYRLLLTSPDGVGTAVTLNAWD